ncbi:MAG: hypothetical protein IJ489_00650 [Clostridia bacterium]|nr:hypothetical protein [Clostridia bacterium]
MKKFLLLILVLSFVFTIASCASEQMDDSASDSTNETTTTSDTSDTSETTTLETTTEYDVFPPYTDTTETTVNHPYGGTGGLPSDETTGTFIETTTATESVDRYNLGLEYIMEYEAVIITDGEEYQPYTSTVYYQNPYMVGDGILMFVSMENQLPHWIADDVIPYIPVNTSSEVSFDYHEEAELRHSGKFRIYVQNDDGSVTKVAELLGSTISEVYAYGKENLLGKTVYISYPFLLKTGDYSALTDGVFASSATHDIMCIFKTSF